MVEDVIELRAKFDLYSLSDRHPLHDIEIEVVDTASALGVTAQCSGAPDVCRQSDVSRRAGIDRREDIFARRSLVNDHIRVDESSRTGAGCSGRDSADAG